MHGPEQSSYREVIIGDIFIKDPNLDVSCGTDAIVGQQPMIRPGKFSYIIVNDSDDEAFVSMVAALTVSTDPNPVFTNQDLQRLISPHSSFAQGEFTISAKNHLINLASRQQLLLSHSPCFQADR